VKIGVHCGSYDQKTKWLFFGTLCMYALSDHWALLVLAGTPKNQSHSPGGANALTKLMHCASSRCESPLCMSSRSVQPFLHCPPIRANPESSIAPSARVWIIQS